MAAEKREKPPTVFVCYASEDFERVKSLVEVLKAAGADPWLDRERILPGQRWPDEIRRAISECDYFLALLTQQSLSKKGFVQNELSEALDLMGSFPADQIFLIPARLDDCEPHKKVDKMKNVQWIDLFPSLEPGFGKLLKALKLERGASNYLSLAEGVGIEFVRIPPGTFQMGSMAGEPDERPVRAVAITQSFELGKCPVTQLQWHAIMGSRPSRFPGWDRPVERLSWRDVQNFVRRLNLRGDGFVYRLPTEAEWEYAARARETGDFPEKLEELAWYGKSSDTGTSPVGTRLSNPWGLCDMYGNVWEWLQDWYRADYYGMRPDPDADPDGPPSGETRVIRGGSWLYPASNCRCAYRNFNPPEDITEDIGFRLLRRAMKSS